MGASQFGGGCQSLGLRLEQPLAFQLWLSRGCLSASSRVEGHIHSRPAVLWYSLYPLFFERARLQVRAFCRKVLSLSFSPFFPLWRSHSLGCYLTFVPQIVLRAFRPSSYLPVHPLLMGSVCKHLGYFSAGSCG